MTGWTPLDQIGLDRAMIELDGTANKGRLGANAILGVSLAVAKAAAQSSASCRSTNISAGLDAHVLPVPMMNIINGGAHADNPIDMQEFMILPVGAESFAHAVQIGSEIFHTLKKALQPRTATTPTSATRAALRRTSNRPTAALDYIVKSIETAGYKPGKDVFLGARLRRDRVLQGRQVRDGGRGQDALARPRTSTSSPGSPTSSRSSPSRTAWPRTTGTAGRR